MLIYLELDASGTKFPFDKEYNENLKKVALGILGTHNKPGWALIHNHTVIFGFDSAVNTNGAVAFGAYIALYYQRVFKTEIVGKVKVDEFSIIPNPLEKFGGTIKATAELLYEEYADTKAEDLFGQVPIVPFNKFPEEFRNGFLITHVVQ